MVSRCMKQFQSKCSFSIDHILNVAGEKKTARTDRSSSESEEVDEEKKFEWLNCTRYRPPKLQRQRKKEGVQRRKLGRNPRIPFSSSQVAFLEAKFSRQPYLSSTDVTQLALHLQLSETRVKIWFQNRRARERRDRESKSSKDSSGTRIQAMERHEQPEANNHHHTNYCHFQPISNYVQLIGPLDLSDRQWLCK